MRCDTADSVEGGTHAGRLQCSASRCLDMADPLLWNRSREPNSGSSRGLRNRPLPCPRYAVTRAQLRSGGQQVRDGGATESGPQVGRGGRTGACRGTAYSGLCSVRVGASSVSSPRWVGATAQRGRRSGAVAGEVQQAGGQWVSRRCWGRRRISRARVGGLGDVWYGVFEAKAHTVGAAGASAGPAACCSCRLCDTRYQS